jgi:hypothetical protein
VNKSHVYEIYYVLISTILCWWKRLDRGTCYFVCILFWLLHKEVIVLSASSTVYIYERDANGDRVNECALLLVLGCEVNEVPMTVLSVLDDVCFILRDVKQMLTECIDI